MVKVEFMILVMVYTVIQCTPLSDEHFSKRRPISRDYKMLEMFRDIFGKLRSDPATAAQESMNTSTSLPFLKNENPTFTIETAKPVLSNVTGCNHTKSGKHSNFITVPVTHSFEKYKIIVVTAPQHIKLTSGDAEPLIIYMVFDDDNRDDPKSPNMPDVYFVTKYNGDIDLSRKEKSEPIWIMNSNRTVTGLKSRDIAKFVNLRRKRGRVVPWNLTPP